MIEQYSGEVIAFATGIAGGIVIRAKLWWNSKSPATRREIILDTMDKLQDGKITWAEAKDTVTKYL